MSKLNHLAMSMNGIQEHAIQNKLPLRGTIAQALHKLRELVLWQVKYDVPIVTVLVVPMQEKEKEHFPHYIDSLVTLLKTLRNDVIVQQQGVKVSVLGKWYDLPNRVIDAVKALLTSTQDNEKYFFNLCINYDGQEEIVDACKLLARKVRADKIDPEDITQESIKENIYSSYFLPPDKVLVHGKECKLQGFLLWDSTQSMIHFSGKSWLDFGEEEFRGVLGDKFQ